MSTPRISSDRNAGFAANPAFRALLTAASDATGADLDALIEGIKDHQLLLVHDAAGEPAALAVYRRIDGFAVELEYLAVAPGLRHQGVAGALVRRIQADAAAMVVARTEDDAIGFYRAAGFHASASPADPRRPSRRRHLCVLPHLPLLRNPVPDDGSVEWIHGEPVPAPVRVVPPSASWPQDFAGLAGRLRDALGSRALAIEHLGSTSVPGLWAKPVIDVVLTVEDPGVEEHYVPRLEAAGFVFRLRERNWYGHRLLVSGPGSGLSAANIHVFAPGCPETARMVAFRRWLCTHPADLDAYARIKRASAERINDRGGGAGLVMDYNRAKEPFIRDLYARILQGNPGPEEG
ncbi:GNAT family N-acetyltransferase [Arthrobacter sp. AQ5-05]|uniref:GNAT family N-acetyltransferase n=1 Tax=Arthrobacter sp. AQ5-05 TaxID=2184581 RepID=UPI001C66204C|nr:GNAT family N-acetyltransferase [Arthrobacter sp. AQ5-05]